MTQQKLTQQNLGDRIVEWAKNDPDIDVLLLLGSRARGIGQEDGADSGSDWDFQLISREPRRFYSPSWIQEAGIGNPLAYVARLGKLGRITKVSVVLLDGELDMAFLPMRKLYLARVLLAVGGIALFPKIQSAFAELCMVLRPGYQLLKGDRGWATFFKKIVREVPPTRLTNNEVLQLAEGFVCDYISTARKIDRGEYLAAQRWIHKELAEVNFRLLHELRLRTNRSSYPDARRIEFLCSVEAQFAVTIAAYPARAELVRALEKCSSTLCVLVSALDCRWEWPNELLVRNNF